MRTTEKKFITNTDTQSKEKRTYAMPAILEEEIYKTYANLYCSKSTGAGCGNTGPVSSQ